MKRIAIFAFSGDMTAFAHALLNSVELLDRGFDVRLIIEGGDTGLLTKLERDESNWGGLFRRALEAGVIFGVCRACAAKTGGLASAERIGLPVLDEMSGHPSFATQLEEGFDIISI